MNLLRLGVRQKPPIETAVLEKLSVHVTEREGRCRVTHTV